MRIAFLAGHLSRRASGVRQMIEGLSQAVSARGVNLKVFGIRDAAWDTGDADTWRGGPAQVLYRLGPASLGYMPALFRALAAWQPGLVHLHGIWMYSSHVAAQWAGRQRRPLVVSPHGMLAPRALAYSQCRKRVVRALFQDRCFARTRAYHATAQVEADDIRARLGNVPIEVVPNGVKDAQVLLPRWAARSRRIVAIGRLHPVKGYDRLLRAWAMVEPHASGWSLEIAGPDVDGHSDALRRLAAELGLQRAKVSPACYGAERDEMIAGARLFALPSLTENFALTVPEALICGTPVLASTGAPWEGLLANRCGWWVAPEPEALAQVLLEAVRLPDETLAEMGAAGRAWALRDFGWDGIAARMIHFYETLHSQAKDEPGCN